MTANLSTETLKTGYLRVGVMSRIRAFVRRTPRIYLPLVQFRRRTNGSRKVLNNHTELIIDSFPRSGNTFAVYAFLAAQRRPVILAHHFHAPAIIAAGAQRDIPVLTTIRHPVDAIASCLIYKNSTAVRATIQDYVEFYQAVARFRSKLFRAPFEAVITDFQEVMMAFNTRFGTRYDLFEHTPENVASVFNKIENMPRRFRATGEDTKSVGWARPNQRRELSKSEVKKRLLDSPFAHKLERAQSLFAELHSSADVVKQGQSTDGPVISSPR